MSGWPVRHPTTSPLRRAEASEQSCSPCAPEAWRVGLVLRVPVFAAVNAALAAGAHATQTGAGLAPAQLVAALGISAVLGALLCRRERSFEVITMALLTGQAAVHAVLTLTGDLARRGLHPHGWPAAGPVAHIVPGTNMLLAHLLAAGVAAWWLHRGEAAVWAALRRVWPNLGTSATSSTPTITEHGSVAVESRPGVIAERLTPLRPCQHRGPPAGVVRA